MKTPPAPSEDRLFSPQSPAPARGQPDQRGASAQHASSSDSGMSDERNANSVLFTLSAVQAKAVETGAPRQMARLAAAPPSDAGSGLIDLNTLGADSGSAEETADSSASSSGLASGAALSQSSLLSSSSVMPLSQAPSPAPASAPSRTPLIVLSVLAVLALVAAIGAIALRG